MEHNNYLAQNLKTYKSLQKKSLRTFAEQLGIPTSTLSNLLKDGNTTLDTAIRLSENLNISMDMLFKDDNLPHKLIVMHQINLAKRWLDDFPEDKQKEICRLFSDVWTAMGK